MDYFIIGDIHGCYYTLIEMLKNWNHENEYLILVGDLIDRGNFSAAVVTKCHELAKKNKNCIILKGNHEFEFVEYFKNGHNQNWIEQCGQKTIDDFQKNKIDHEQIANWFQSLPLKFENNTIVVTHAGISESKNPFDENNMDGVIWNRKELKNINKIQIHGHTPILKNEPVFNKLSNSWNIDTGAFYGFGLTGIKINNHGKIIGKITVETNKKDIA
ncbi:metallophosphoesterase family protein [Kordia sp.]|uniref:metallophosphoesterase family protein n=1 Tax=Kordia sp. TaxID=1965332 RepID=UPI003B596F2E